MQVAPWQGKYVSLVAYMVLVKSVLTIVANYHLTPLDLPVEVWKKIDNLGVLTFGWVMKRSLMEMQNQTRPSFQTEDLWGTWNLESREACSYALPRWLWFQLAEPANLGSVPEPRAPTATNTFLPRL